MIGFLCLSSNLFSLVPHRQRMIPLVKVSFLETENNGLILNFFLVWVRRLDSASFLLLIALQKCTRPQHNKVQIHFYRPTKLQSNFRGKNAKATKSQGIDTSINQQFKSSSDKIASVATKSSFFNIHDDYHYNYQVLFFSKGKGWNWTRKVWWCKLTSLVQLKQIMFFFPF